MKALKILTVVGTRPEIIRLSRVLAQLDKYCDHVLVHTGQNYDYELNELFFEQLGIRKPDIFLDAVKGTPSETVGDIIAKADKVFDDAVTPASQVEPVTKALLLGLVGGTSRAPASVNASIIWEHFGNNLGII